MSKQTSLLKLETIYRDQLAKALRHLGYSYNKVQGLPTNLPKDDEEILETWESFATRFTRTIDIYLTKYIKVLVKKEDPGFEGTLRDYLNYAEKMQALTQVDRWMSLRELRNIQAHEYAEDVMEKYLKTLVVESQFILAQLEDFAIAPQ